MANNKFEDLLARLPEIAKAVNEFSSPDLQAKAFDALMRAAGVGAENAAGAAATGSQTANAAPAARRASGNGASAKQGSGRKAADQYSLLDLDFHPNGSPTLRDFFREKSPKNDPQRYACIVYYFKHFSPESEVTVNHIFTAFKALGLKVPNIAAGINNTRARHGWVTMSEGQVTLTRIGENMVEHELPIGGRETDT